MVWRSAGYIRPVWVFLLHSFKLPGILALCSYYFCFFLAAWQHTLYFLTPTLSPAPYWVSALFAPEPYHIRLVLLWPCNVTSSASRCGELNKQRHHPQKRNTHHGYNSSLHAMNEPTQDSTKAILSPRKPKVKPGPRKQPLSSIFEPYKFAKPAITPSRQRKPFTKFKLEALA